MALDQNTHSRRSLLAAGVAALAATVGHALGRPSAALGADADNAVLGRVNRATRTTEIRTDLKAAIWGSSKSSVGVIGSSKGGVGVTGRSTTRDGVAGTSEGGTGVSGYAQRGVGVYASSGEGSALVAQAEPGYYAIETHGNIHFESSGVGRIPTGQVSVTVFPNLPIMNGSFVLLTAHDNLHGRDLWYTTDPGPNTITIKISSLTNHPILVSWLLLS